MPICRNGFLISLTNPFFPMWDRNMPKRYGSEHDSLSKISLRDLYLWYFGKAKNALRTFVVAWSSFTSGRWGRSWQWETDVSVVTSSRIPGLTYSEKVRSYLSSKLSLLCKRFNKCSVQKQPSTGVLRKRCSENMQQIYRGAPIPKCDFNKVSN